MKKVFILLLFLLLSITRVFSQTRVITFEWTNGNTVPVKFHIYEMKAPPDTNTTAQLIIRDIPDCKTGSYVYNVNLDGKYHYFRMVAFTAEKTSPFSNLCSIQYAYGLLSPVLKVTFK